MTVLEWWQYPDSNTAFAIPTLQNRRSPQIPAFAGLLFNLTGPGKKPGETLRSCDLWKEREGGIHEPGQNPTVKLVEKVQTNSNYT